MSDKETFLRNFAKPILFKKAPPMEDRCFHEPAKKAAPVERIEPTLSEGQFAESTAHPAKSLGVAGLANWQGQEAALETLSKLEFSPGELGSARYAGANLFLFLFLSSKEDGPLRHLLRSELKQLLSETSESPASAPPSSPGVL